MKYKYFAFSDTHGCFDALAVSLEKAGFDIDNQSHILIGVGDYFDRGDRNAQIYRLLTDKKLEGRVHLVKGNHDDMLKEFLNGMSDGVFNATYNGLNKTIGNFAQVNCNVKMLDLEGDYYRNRIKSKYPGLMKFLNSMVDTIIIDEYFITHAGLNHVNKYADWDEPIWEVDNWARTDNFVLFFEPKMGDYELENKIFVVGHWHAKRLRALVDQPSNHEMFVFKHFIGLDACTNLSGFVNVLVIDSDSEVIKR